MNKSIANFQKIEGLFGMRHPCLLLRIALCKCRRHAKSRPLVYNVPHDILECMLRRIFSFLILFFKTRGIASLVERSLQGIKSIWRFPVLSLLNSLQFKRSKARNGASCRKKVFLRKIYDVTVTEESLEDGLTSVAGFWHFLKKNLQRAIRCNLKEHFKKFFDFLISNDARLFLRLDVKVSDLCISGAFSRKHSNQSIQGTECFSLLLGFGVSKSMI